jgi:NADH-ubiquinone oxidoreductase chain 5
VFKKFYNFFNKKWFFDRIYNEFASQTALKLSYQYSYKIIDRGLIEKIGPFGIVEFINLIINSIKSYQSGLILNYLTYFLIFIFIFILSIQYNFFVLYCLFVLLNIEKE